MTFLEILFIVMLCAVLSFAALFILLAVVYFHVLTKDDPDL